MLADADGQFFSNFDPCFTNIKDLEISFRKGTLA